MYKKERNEKSFIWHDIKISTVYGRLYPDASPIPHSHSQFELFVFKSVKGYIKTDTGRIKLSRNSAVIIPPRTNHALILHEDNNFAGFMIRFNYKKINDLRKLNSDPLFSFFDSLMPQGNHLLTLKDKYFGEFYDTFFSECESNQLLASSLIKHILEGLFLRLLRCLKSPETSSENVPIYSYKNTVISNDVIAATIIDDHMSMPGCTLKSLSSHLQMSPRNVQRILKKTYNKTFTERMSQIRLSKAVNLMTNTTLSLNEISEISNYNRYDSFRKAFMTAYGVTPTEYREKIALKK